MSEPPVQIDEAGEQFARVMAYVTEWANTDARREDVMSTLWTVMNRRPKFAATLRPPTETHR